MALTQISTNGVKDGSLKNADVASDAAIALSKLATGALPSGLTVASANITDGTIVNADINSSAAIALSKISISGTGSSSNYLRGDGSWQAVPAGGIGSESSSKRYVIAGPQAGEDIGGDGDDNTLIGYQAGKEINGTYGKKVTAIGSYACRDQTSGQGVVAVGYKALASNTTNEGNTVVGYEAQTTSTSAHSCTSIGRQANYSLQSGDHNTAIGNQAIYNLTTGTECTAVGDATGKLWGSGSFRNTAIGRNAFSSGSAGTVNYGTAVGWEALYKNNSGEGNTAVGSRALYDVTDGTYNVGVGRDSGENISSGDYNVCIGYEAGDNLTTANNNICIGYGADPENATDDNRVTIGNSNITSFEVPGCNFKVVTSTASNDYILKIGAGNAARWEQDLGAIAHGWGNHASGGYAAYSHTHTTYLTSDTADTAQGDITFAGGAGAVTISSSNGSDIRFQNSGAGSTATGMASLRLKDHFFLIQGGESGIRFVTEDGTARWQMNDAGKIQPLADASYDIGGDGARVGSVWAQYLRGDGSNITNLSAPSVSDSDNYSGSHICMGTNAGKYTSANYKICIGSEAGRYGSARHNNVFIGVEAGKGTSLSNGQSNVCIGQYTGKDLTTGSSNTCLGPNAGEDITTGNHNVIVGSAGRSVQSSAGSLILGYSAGYSITESSYSVIIGHGASGETLQGDAADNQLFIARQGYGGGSSGTWIYGNSSGQCQQGGGSSSWYTGSDERYKDFLGKYPRGLAEINQLDVQNYKWKNEEDMPSIAFNNAGSYCGPEIDGKTRVGIGAQSCEKVIPEAVNKHEPCDLEKGGNHMLTLDNDPIFWAMINAIQELSSKFDALASRVTALES